MRKLLCLLLLACVLPARAALNIEITEGAEGALPIAVSPFKWSGKMPADGDVSAIVVSDLARSGKFSPMPENRLPARPQSPQAIDFKTWRMVGMDHLVIGAVDVLPGGKYRVQFRLFDVLKGRQVLGYRFTATRKTLRAIAHQISDYIFTHITGLPGAFSSRIAYVTARHDKQQGYRYRLQVADTDGYNPQTLLTSDQPIMSPSWSPDGSQLAYVSFEKGRAEIYTHDIRTGVRKLRTAFAGLNGAPAWSPDGKQLALTLSKGGNPDIYLLNLQTGKLRQLTRHWAIDTEAAWLPDGSGIVFTSARSGKPQLYLKKLDSDAPPRRLTFEGGYNANASVSPDGKKLAFVHGQGGKYHIALMSLDAGGFHLLTDGPQDESPEFAPNDSIILFASQAGGSAVLAAVSVDGRQKQRLAFSEGDVREPAWAMKRY